MEQARKTALAELLGIGPPPVRIRESYSVNPNWERLRMRVWLNECLKDPSKHPAAVLVELGYATSDGAAGLAEQWLVHPFVVSRTQAFLNIFESQSIHTRDSVMQEAWNFYHECQDEEVKLNLLKQLMKITGVTDDAGEGGTGSVINNIAIAIQQVKERRSEGNRVASIR